MIRKLKSKAFIITILSLLYFLPTKASLAEGQKPITSWKDIVIGKTTEEEIISSNPEGMVYLSAGKLLSLCKNKATFRTISYGSERSYAEEKRRNDKFLAQGYEIAQREDSKDLYKAIEFLSPPPKLDDYLKPVLLYNGPIDLRWDKLGKVKLEIASDGVVLGWAMKYWFYDPSDPSSFHDANRSKRYPNKEEILEIFEAELGKPQKILKPESLTDEYIFSFDKRNLILELSYRFENKVVYIEFREGKSEQELFLGKVIELLATSLSKDSEADKEAKNKEVADFARKHKDFEQVRPVMYELSLDPQNKDLSLQELYDKAKKQIKDK